MPSAPNLGFFAHRADFFQPIPYLVCGAAWHAAADWKSASCRFLESFGVPIINRPQVANPPYIRASKLHLAQPNAHYRPLPAYVHPRTFR